MKKSLEPRLSNLKEYYFKYKTLKYYLKNKGGMNPLFIEGMKEKIGKRERLKNEIREKLKNCVDHINENLKELDHMILTDYDLTFLKQLQNITKFETKINKRIKALEQQTEEKNDGFKENKTEKILESTLSRKQREQRENEQNDYQESASDSSDVADSKEDSSDVAADSKQDSFDAADSK